MATMTEPQRLSQPSSADALPEAPPYLWAGFVALGALILYVATLAPTTQFWDTSEYIAAAYVLGIPHPPGNPLFTLIAHTWGLLPLTSTNHMMGVLVGPVVMVLLYPPFKRQRAMGLGGLAARRIEWSQWLVFCSAYALIVASGLESSTPLKLAAVLFAAALVYALAYARNGDFAVAVLLVAVVGVSVYLFLPIRAAHFPAINEGEPTTSAALWDVLTRQQYGKPPVWQRQATPQAQIGMWIQYFTWQWGRDWATGARGALAVVFAFVGSLGAYRHWKADRRTAVAMTTLMATLTLLLIFYLNFKYGYSQRPDLPQALHEVRERDYFFIASFALL